MKTRVHSAVERADAPTFGLGKGAKKNEGWVDARMSVALARRYRAVSCAAVTAPIGFERGEGSWLVDLEGNRYLDFIGGYGVVNTGWQHPRVVEAVREQASRACFAPPWFPSVPAAELGERLVRLPGVPPGGKCLRATGGADANEQVLKAVRTWTARKGKAEAADGADDADGRGYRPAASTTRVLCLERSYHGGTAATLALSDTGRFSLPRVSSVAPQPRVPPPFCSRCPWGKVYGRCGLECAKVVDAALADDSRIAAVIVEPVIGSGGVIVPPPEYLAEVRAICDRRGRLLIFDEVLTGFGRTGAMLAAEREGVTPDAVTLGKGLSAGAVPIGAAVVSRALAEAAEDREDCSATFAWTPLGCAAARANMQVVEEEGLVGRSAKLGRELLTGVRAACERRLPDRIGEARGIGMMVGVDLVRDRESREADPMLVRRLALRCKRHGLIIGTSWDWSVIVLLPPLTLTEGEMREGVARFEEAVGEV